MTRLLVGNDFSVDARTDRGWTGWWVQRLVWFAEDGDVLVLPTLPDESFVDYVTALTGTRRESLRVLTPPGVHTGMLGPDQLADPELLAAIHAAVAGREVTEVFALWPDTTVAQLARSLGVQSALPGFGFADQAGGLLVNSKAAFRAIAGGAGVPVPDGAVCTSLASAERAILRLLDDDSPVIIKHEFLSGGHGNEILCTGGELRPVGARRVVTLSGREAVYNYLLGQWDWLSGGGRGRPVVERYFPDSPAYFAEFVLADDEVRLAGDGELLSAPYAVGQVMPAAGLVPEALETIVAQGHRLCEPVRAMGYRGVLSADAIVTPGGEVLFTEYNGRVTGSTHIYERIGRHVVGPGYGKDRVILERVWPETWSVPSFAAAVDRLSAAGLGYDPGNRSGVVLTNAFDNRNGVMFCVVAENLDLAWACDHRLSSVFGAG